MYGNHFLTCWLIKSDVRHDARCIQSQNMENVFISHVFVVNSVVYFTSCYRLRKYRLCAFCSACSQFCLFLDNLYIFVSEITGLPDSGMRRAAC